MNFGAGTSTQGPPSVDVGADQTIVAGAAANLSAVVTDDGLPDPPGAVTTMWSAVSGPGSVVFADDTAVSTTATFTQPGQYVLRLSANDGTAASSDELMVTVETNQAPTVDAGADQATEPSAATALSGAATDDGWPTGTVDTLWSVVSGPGTVVFTDATAAVTTATFSTVGSYVLRLTADDGDLQATDDVEVTVAQNEAPTVTLAAGSSVAAGQPLDIGGTITDDGLPFGSAITVQWTVEAGPGPAAFADATEVSTQVTFDVEGSYTLRLTADDTEFTAFDEIVVVVDAAPPLAAPTFDPVAGTYTGSVLVSIVSGPGEVVRYTLTGVDPDINSPIYTEPILVAESTVVRAKAFDGPAESAVASADYVIEASARATDSLLALYRFNEGSGSVVHDQSGVGTPLDLTIDDPTRTAWTTDGLSVTGSTFVASPGPATKIIDPVIASGAVSVEAWITPDGTNPAGPGRIATISATPAERNVTLGQGFFNNKPTNNFQGRVRTDANDNNTVQSPANFVNTQLTHVVYTRDSGGATELWVDGTRVGTWWKPGSTANWNTQYRLVLANELAGTRSWLGTYDLMAMYGKALTAAEIQQNFAAGPNA